MKSQDMGLVMDRNVSHDEAPGIPDSRGNPLLECNRIGVHRYHRIDQPALVIVGAVCYLSGIDLHN